MRITILFLAAFLPLLAVAQKKDKSILKFAKQIDAAEMKKHLYIIASPEMEGRDTPSPGLEKAADYIEEQFRNLGIAPANKGSYRQYYSLFRDSMTSASLEVNGLRFEMNKDFQPFGNNYAASMRFSEIVFAGYGILDGEVRNDYEGLDVAGKMVMILDGVPAGYKPSVSGFQSPATSFGKMSSAMKKGATALIIVYNNFPRNNMNTGGNWNMNAFRSSQPPFTFSVSPSVAAAMLGKPGLDVLTAYKDRTLVHGMFTSETMLEYSKVTKTTQVSNILGMIEGSDKKDEYVFVTAHYDHVGKRSDGSIYYGADDDGSGTTAVIEMAQAFAKAKAEGKGPRRTMVFMLVSGEEKGLWGSRYYTEHPIFPLEKTTVDLNIDMIGRIGNEYQKDKDSTNYVYVIGDDKLSTELTPITDQVNAQYGGLKLDRKYNDPNDPNRFYYRSDHYNFAEKGVPVIFYFNGVHADYHKPTDTPDKINYSLMEKRGRFIFHTAWEMANREQMIRRDLALPKAF
jgi:hypothetical protein